MKTASLIVQFFILVSLVVLIFGIRVEAFGEDGVDFGTSVVGLDVFLALSLSAATVVLAGVAIVVGILAFIGWQQLRTDTAARVDARVHERLDDDLEAMLNHQLAERLAPDNEEFQKALTIATTKWGIGAYDAMDDDEEDGQ